jgi:hypothetical protein
MITCIFLRTGNSTYHNTDEPESRYLSDSIMRGQDGAALQRWYGYVISWNMDAY